MVDTLLHLQSRARELRAPETYGVAENPMRS